MISYIYKDMIIYLFIYLKKGIKVASFKLLKD